MPARLWCFSDQSAGNISNGAFRELGLAPALSCVLTRAGLTTAEAMEGFLNPRLRQLGDPFAINGVREAAERILQAIDRGEPVTLYGDYDVDGITSVALLARLLRAYGLMVSTFLPLRVEEGYGLSAEGVQRCLATSSPKLLVALDCGTSSADRIASLEQQGIDVIVVDHHSTPTLLPRCSAFVNPKTSRDHHYFCTAGLVFKLCHGLLKLRSLPGVDLKDYLDLVAIGTVADLVPLIQENRILVRHGLLRLGDSRWAGLRALNQVCRVSPPIQPAQVGFRLGPRLNAAGRLGVAQEALELLLTDDRARAQNLAESLDRQNRARQEVEQRTLDEALALLKQSFDQDRHSAIVVAARNWHPGVVGIVASRLVRQFHRPSLVIGFDEEGKGKGSGRSIPGFSLVKALDACREYLELYGGHDMAAGLSISPERFDAFAEAFRQIAGAELSPTLLHPRLTIDSEVLDAELNFDFLSAHGKLQPFGIGNPAPIFCLRGVNPTEAPKIVQNKHRLLTVRQRHRVLSALHFNSVDLPLPEPPWDIAFALESNVFRDKIQLQLQVEEIRTAEELIS
jgi:single-stranded-DNA-specific exonuclease